METLKPFTMKIRCNPLWAIAVSPMLLPMLLLLLAGLPTVSRCQALYGFTLATGEDVNRVIKPDESTTVNVQWNETETEMNVTALLDGDPLPASSLTAATANSAGSAEFAINGNEITIGRHVLEVSCIENLNETEAENITVIVHNQWPVAGLVVNGLDADGKVWVVSDSVVNLTAQVTTGSQLKADWLQNNVVVIHQEYSDSGTFLYYTNTWDTPATYSFRLIVSNQHNSFARDFSLVVLRPINGISLNTTEVESETDVSVTMRILFASDMQTEVGQVDYNVNWKDGSEDPGILSIESGSYEDFQHTYSAQSDYKVKLTLTSKADSKDFIFTAKIWNLLADLDLSVSPNVTKPGEHFTVTFINPPSETFHFTIECGYDSSTNVTVVDVDNASENVTSPSTYTNENALYSTDFEPPTISLVCFYLDEGSFDIVMRAENEYYSKEASKTVVVQAPFSASDYKIDPAEMVVPLPDGSITMTVKVRNSANPLSLGKGWCFWVFDSTIGGTGIINVDHYSDFPQDATYQYTAQGSYLVQFNCANNISEIVLNATITVKNWMMEDFEVVVNNPQVMNDLIPVDDVMIMLKLFDISRPPDDLTALFYYGDVNDSSSRVITSLNTYHRYPERRVYHGSVDLAHPQMGHVTKDFTVWQGALQISLDRLGGIAEVDKFIFKVDVPNDFIGKLCIYFGYPEADNWVQNVDQFTLQKKFTIEHYYSQVGDWRPYVTGEFTNGSNQYNETSFFTNDIIDIEGNVANLSIILPGIISHPPGHTVAELKLDRGKHRIRNMTCYINFNDALNQTIVTRIGGLQPGESWFFSFTYITLGSRDVTANCSDIYSSDFAVQFTLVSNKCFSDDPIFDRRYGYFAQALVHSRSHFLRRVTRTIILCTDVKPFFLWKVELYDYDFVFKEHVLLRQPDMDFIEFFQGSLEIGVYKLALNISFDERHDFIWLAETTYVKVIAAPLRASIMGGNHRLTGNPFNKVNGYTQSYDPVFGIHNKTGIQFLWECEVLNTATMAELTQMSSQPFNTTLTGDCDDISTETEPGNRTLQLADKSVPNGFLFRLRIQKDGKTSVAANLFLQYDPNAFTIEVICLVNCDQKVAVTSPLKLKVDCDTCTKGEYLHSEYVWRIELFNNITKSFEEETHVGSYFQSSGLDTGPQVTILQNKLQPCSVYRFWAEMTLSLAQKSAMSSFEVVVNCPPFGGFCNVTPSEGDVLTTRFAVNCFDWLDDGFAIPDNFTENPVGSVTDDSGRSLYYKFLLRKGNIVVPVDHGGESAMQRVQLPFIGNLDENEHELIARIYDVLNDYTEVIMIVNLKVTISNDPEAMSVTTTYWHGQIVYGSNASTTEKLFRSISTTCVYMGEMPENDTRNELQKAYATDGETVMNNSWDMLLYDSNHPVDYKDETTEEYSQLVFVRNSDSEKLSGMGVGALGESITCLMHSSYAITTTSVVAFNDIASSGSGALKTICGTEPFPFGEIPNDAVNSLMGVIDEVLNSGLPEYNLAVGGELLYNSSTVGEEEETFLMSMAALDKKLDEEQRINTTHGMLPKLTGSFNTMLSCLLAQQVLGQPQTTLERGGVALAVLTASVNTLNFNNMSVSTFTLSLGINQSDPDSVAKIEVTYTRKNMHAKSSDGSSYEIKSPVVNVNVSDEGGGQLGNLTLKIARGETAPVPELQYYCTTETRWGPDGWLNHHMTLRSGSATVMLFFKSPAGFTKVVGYLRSTRRPFTERYDLRVEGVIVSDEEVPVSNDTSALNDTVSVDGPTFKFFVPPGYLSPGIVYLGFELPELTSNETFWYGFMGFSDMCRVWDDSREIWDPSSCVTSDESNAYETVCSCDNPPGTSFASSFFVAPNTIDFSSVFSKFDITNASVYGTLIGIGLVWVLILLWARRKDKEDRDRWLLGYLMDNLVDDNYFYLLTVQTGFSRGAGTLSNVRFILTGSKGDTGVRVLSDGRRTLDTGSVMSYIMATTQGLGDLSHIRIWHDNSGPNGKAAWFFSRMTVENLQTDERYNFMCDKWLAIDRDDGLLDRFVPVSLKDDVMTFDKLFSEHARVGVTDTHLWISCFLRPERSTFSRMQRVTCCLALLLLTMLTSAMFYQPEDLETGESTNALGSEVRIGIMRFSMTTLWTSTVSIIITTIPLLLFVMMFRSSRPRHGPRAKAQNHRRKGVLMVTKASKRLSETEKAEENLSDVMDDVLQENPLPHFCIYITWILLLATIAACAFFLLLYSMQWGKTTSEEWLGSFFLSFFESIFIMDPVKVLVIACLLAYCAGNPYFSTQTQYIDLQRVHVEAETFGCDQIDPTAIPPDPVPDSILVAARKRRAQEQLAQQVFFELILYIFYIFCVFSVSYGHRDDNTHLVNSHLNNLFYAADGDASLPFESVSSREDVMTYMNTTLRDTGFPWTNMLGEDLHWKLRYFTSDLISFRVGPIRVRQVRMPPRGKAPKVTRMYPSLKINSRTFPPYSLESEESRHFCLDWELRSCTSEERRRKLTLPSWRYLEDVTSAPVWGVFAFYPSGGYVIDLTINRDIVGMMIAELATYKWLDLQTKAVFVEMTVYNPNINLFTFMRMGVEFPEVGSAFVWKDFKTVRLYSHLGATGAFVFMCQLILMVITLIFTVKAIIKLKKQKLAYFGDFWQLLDLTTLSVCYTGIGLYAVKTVTIDQVMEKWRHNPKVYVDFYLSVLYDEIYTLILAALVFVVSIRILRILGYNKRITMIATVLARSGSDLLGFFVVFFIVLTAYMTACVVLFASSMYQFRSVLDSYLTLYLVLLGKNVLGRFIGAAPLEAQVFYTSLTIFVIFILYTMFQAILCNSTSMVRANIQMVPPPYGLTNVLQKFYRGLVADWIPPWLVRKSQAVEPAGAVNKPAPVFRPRPVNRDDRTQPHRVLASLSEHFNKFYQGEEKKAKKKIKKTATVPFTNLSTERSRENTEASL